MREGERERGKMRMENPKLDWNAFFTISFHLLQCLWSGINEEELRRGLEEGKEKDEDGESY